MKKLVLLILSSYTIFNLCGQTSLPVPRNIQAAYDKGTRDLSGAPGKNYWQNSGKYDIRISFNPLNRAVTGSENIVYTNNSPDTLKWIVFKLFPNIYSKGAPRLNVIDSSDISPAVKITNLKIEGEDYKPSARGTTMFLRLKGILPKSSVNISLDFYFRLNKGSYLRTGESDEGSWFLAYFFPRIAVYDDIDGWDVSQYLGLVEFYNDFPDFKLAVTVPKDYVVWATGTLINPAEVLTPVYLTRLSAAEKSDHVSTIIDSTDIAAGGITVDKPYNTFRFEAENVTDVAAAISNHYMWRSSSVLVDSSSGRRTRVDAVFSQKKKDFFEVAEFARKTVKSMSYYFPKWPYPYQHETVFNSRKTRGGMEYPMMVSDGNFPDRTFTIDVTLHEVFHTMFPFYTGLNETKYGWMDEGLAEMSNWILMPQIDSSLQSVLVPGDIKDYSRFAGSESDMPIITLSGQLDDAAYQFNSYTKPAIALIYLRDMLGNELFLKGIHQFIRNWHGKHPTPFDFFYSMNQGTGMNLNWYWKKWYLEKGVPDLAVTGLTSNKDTRIIRIEMK
ncbi:MAG: M1 family metallopeptidase, partial [Bacteroidota bacterium]|nr:M1 family metallopeptidase [Bacteroidota bacterium]